MPRIARQISSSGVYHVFMRGVDRYTIFQEAADYQRFKAIVAKSKKTSDFELYGYCLMSNHVHLLLKTGSEDIGAAIKRVAAGYAAWFNWKYERVGHLFQDRFGSEPIETDDHLLTALRYIHQNPIKAGICHHPVEYAWSSYLDYMDTESGLADIDFVKGLASDNSKNWREWLIGFSCLTSDVSLLDYPDQPRKTDTMLSKRVCEEFVLSQARELGTWEGPKRDHAIRILRDAGFGLRQIARVTGIPYGYVRRS